MNERDMIRTMTRNAIVAALYFVLTVSLGSFSFMNIQVRISEALILLCFFRKDYITGLTFGCLLANTISPLGMIDMVVGTLATVLSCLAIMFMKKLLIAAIFPVIFNAFIVAAELAYVYELPYWLSTAEVAIGEAISVMVIGYILFMIIGKSKRIQKIFGANQNLNFKW